MAKIGEEEQKELLDELLSIKGIEETIWRRSNRSTPGLYELPNLLLKSDMKMMAKLLAQMTKVILTRLNARKSGRCLKQCWFAREKIRKIRGTGGLYRWRVCFTGISRPELRCACSIYIKKWDWYSQIRKVLSHEHHDA
jgi:hypothetical protein